MSNLLKSKFLLGVMIVAVMLVGAVVLTPTADAADCSALTITLRSGMRNTQVKCLQQMLNEKGYNVDGVGAGSAGLETTYFGPATKAAVLAFQRAKGLTPDGIFGPASRGALGASGSVSGSFAPAGCTSASGYSPTLGLAGGACYAVASVGNSGCQAGWLFNPATGLSCTGGVVTQTGPVSVALSSDTPASGSVIAPSSGAIFAKYLFTGNGTVTAMKLTRTGISGNTVLTNIYLYDGSTRLTDGATLGSDNTATFNAPSGLFTVIGSKVISVVAEVANVGDYSVGLNLTSVTSGATATAVNLVGNVQYIATSTLSKATVAAATASGDTDAGVDVVVWQSTANVDLRDVLLKSLALRNIGSISSSDIKNFKLYVDGTLVATVASLDSNGYVTFATPVVLRTGARILKVTADVLGGSGRTVQMSLRGAYDLQTTDTSYNANGTTVASSNFPNSPTAFTVNSGSLTVVKAVASPSSNVTRGASDQTLATYTFTAYGEPIKVETLKVGMITTGGTETDNRLRNTRILVNGAQVGSNTSVPAAASFAANSGTSFTTNFVVYPGTPATVEIHADIYDDLSTDNIAAGTTTAVKALLVGITGSGNATRQTSLGMIMVPATTNVEGSNLTISAGTMSVAITSSYANQLTAIPATAYKIGSFQLTGNSTEDVNLNTIYVGWTGASTAIEPTELSNLYVVYGGTMSSVKGTVAGSGVSTTASDNSNSWSVNKVLAKNETMQIDVYATIAGTLTGTGVINATLAVAGTTASSGIAIYADGTANTVLDAGLTGQTITRATGSVTMSQDASTAVAQIVDDNSVVKTLTAKIAAVTDAYTVTDMVVTVTNASAVSTVTLKDHDTGVVIGAAKPGATSITWSGLTLAITAGTTKKIDVELALTPVGVGAGTSGAILTTAITGFTARNSAGTSAAGTGSASGNAVYVYQAIPTVTNVALPTTILGTGTQTVSKFTVASTGGTIGWKKIIFTVTRAMGGVDTLATPTVWDANTGIQVDGAGTFTDSIEIDGDTSGTIVFIATNEQQISGSKTYVLKVVTAGTLVTGDNINVSIAQPSGYVAPAAYATVAGTGSAFTWTDTSASSHAEGTLDWSNSYLVRTLPTDTQTLTK